MVGIVGAGISGLALGRELSERGIPHVILESSERVGGLVRTVRVGGRHLDLGPQRLRAFPELEALFPGSESLRTIEGHPPVLVYSRGRLHPLPRSVGEALRTPALSSRGKLRAALEPLYASIPTRRGDSAGSYLRRRMGREAYQVFLGPLFGGLYGSDPDEMDADRSLRPGMDALGFRSFVGSLVRASLPGGDPASTGATPTRRSPGTGLMRYPIVVPEGGMESLARALLRFQEGEVRLSCPVTTIRRRPCGAGFVVQTPHGTLDCEHIVVTPPPGPASTLLAGVAPEMAAAVGQLRMNPLVMVHLEVPRLPDGLGFQVSFGESLRMRGATFSGALDGSGRTAVVFLGGMKDQEVVDTPDPELMLTAAREFTRATGIPSIPIHIHRTAMPAWDRSWRTLDSQRPPQGVHLLSAYSGRPGIIGRFREAGRLADALQRAG